MFRTPVWCPSLIALLPLLLPTPAAAQNPEWSLDASTAAPIAIPDWLRADSLRDALAYERVHEIRGLVVDLNRDGVRDYVFQFSRDVCGTNCQYALLDGRTRQSLGLVGGSVIYIRAQLINGYPVINQYGHSSADAGYWSTLVFDGRQYVTVGTVRLSGEALDSVFATLKNVTRGPPRTGPR